MSSSFLTKIDASDPCFLKIKTTNPSVNSMLREVFTFEVPGYRFMPAYKDGSWDGKIRLWNPVKKEIYTGLLPLIVKELKKDDYGRVKIVGYEKKTGELLPLFDEWLETQEFPHEPDDYQLDAVRRMLVDKRKLILSPTSSGKSFIIFMFLKFLIDTDNLPGKVLLIVPNVSLINQLYENLVDDYGLDEKYIHKLRGKKIAPKDICISTWQSIYKQKKNWFAQFVGVIVDEVHLATAQSLKGIMEKCHNAFIRIGLTGSLRESKVDELVLRGLFGGVYETVSVKELMERGRVADLTIDMVQFDYSAIREETPSIFDNNFDYQDEIQFLLKIKRRDEAVYKLLQRHKDENCVVLFKLTSHGKRLYEGYKKKYPDENVFFVDGSVSGEERKRIYKEVDKSKGAKLFASLGTTSTGVSINNLNVGILATPIKSKVLVLQYLGRLIRISENKRVALIYDIFDDLRLGKKKTSFCEKHAMSRLEKYIEEGHKIKESVILL